MIFGKRSLSTTDSVYRVLRLEVVDVSEGHSDTYVTKPALNPTTT